MTVASLKAQEVGEAGLSGCRRVWTACRGGRGREKRYTGRRKAGEKESVG